MPKKLIIDRQKWITGDSSQSYLLNTVTQKMCCLGFYSNQCGVDKSVIANVGAPSRVSEKLPDEMSWLLDSNYCTDYGFDNSDIAFKLMALNDKPLSKDFLQKDREKRISDIFAEYGVEVEYIN